MAKQLIRQYFKGDQGALEALINENLSPVYNFIYHYVRNSSDAEDITQEVFIKMWRSLRKFDQKKNFRTWLFTIAKNTAIDYSRKKKDIPMSSFDDEEGNNPILDNLSDPSPLPEELFERKDLAEKLDRAMEQLSPNYRSVLVLYYKDGFNFREIAEILGEPIDTIKSRHRRALIKLKEILISY